MIKIHFHPALCAYLFSMFVLSSWETCIGALIALIIHEFGHLAVCCLVHEEIARLELTPFGGIMVYSPGKSPCKGIRGFFIAAAGPAANYILFMYISTNQMSTELMRSIALSCLAMILINTIPALPLDGGRMVFSIGYYLFPLTILITTLTIIGVLAGIGFLALAVCGFIWHKIFNCSLLIVGGYLIYSAWRNREQMLLENYYVVIQEALESKNLIQRVKTYQIPAGIHLIRLLSYLEKRSVCEFVFDIKGDQHRLSEKQLCSILLEQPLLSIEDAFSKNTMENRPFSP